MVKKQTLQDLDNPMVENQQKPQKFPQAEPKKLAEMGLGDATTDTLEESAKILTKFNERWEAMKKAREKAEDDRRRVDKGFKEKPRIKINGMVSPNLCLEEALVETYVGYTPEGLPINIATEGRPDGVLQEISKQALEHFIIKEKITKEVKIKGDNRKARYGTAVYFSGLKVESKFINAEKGEQYLTKGKVKMKKMDTYHVTIQSINPRLCWFDNVADYDDAVDCIMGEIISEDEFRTKFFDENGKPDKKYINLDYVNITSTNIIEEGKEIKKDNVIVLYHYFNKVFGYYRIVANENILIYNGFATTKHGLLPLVPIQHYFNPYSIRGIGIPRRFAAIKAINNDILSDVIGGARLNAGGLLFQGKGTQIDGEIFIEPGELQVVEMTEGNGRDITPFQPSVNVQQLQEILKLLDDYAIILTGLNFKAPYTSPAKTAFETSVMKEEQNNRFKVPLTLRNEGLGLVFGTMLCNIFQYVPYLYSKRLRDEELGKSTLEDKWYQIPITGKKIIRKKEKDSQTATGGQRTIDDILELEDAEGYEDYFEMAPGFFNSDTLFDGGFGLKVYIETPSNQNTMKALEIENILKFINAKIQIMNAKAPLMQTGVDTSERDQIEKKLDQLFNIDDKHIGLKSNVDKFEEKMGQITQLIDQISVGTNPLLPEQLGNETTSNQNTAMGTQGIPENGETNGTPPAGGIQTSQGMGTPV